MSLLLEGLIQVNFKFQNYIHTTSTNLTCTTEGTAYLKKARAGLRVLDLGQDAEDAYKDTEDQVKGDKELMQATAVSLKTKSKIVVNY